MSVPFNERNWLGKGVLVDFSDIVSPHAGKWWLASYYGVEQEAFRRMVERAARRGLLGPPPKPIEEPRRIPAYSTTAGRPPEFHGWLGITTPLPLRRGLVPLVKIPGRNHHTTLTFGWSASILSITSLQP